jgi:spore maturation protein CgeB
MMAEGLRATCYDFWPDVVLIISSFFIPKYTYEVLRSRGHKVVTLFTESPYEDPSQVMIARCADLAIVNDPTNLADFQSATDAVYLPHAYDPDIHCPGPALDQYASDFCFVGTGYPSRVDFFEQVDFRGVDVALAGNWQNLDEGSPLRKYVAHDLEVCCDNTESVDLYRSTKVSANIYRTEAATPDFVDGWAMGPREVELAATGCFYLTQARGENREVLPMVPTFEDPIDLSEQLRWWLAHDDKRSDVSRQARAAIADRTFDNHAAILLRHLGL